MKNIICFIIILLSSTIVQSQVTDLFITNTADFNVSSKNEYTVIENKLYSNYTPQTGAPQLPIYSRSYVLPAGSKVSTLSFSNGSKATLSTNYYVYPAQPPCIIGKPCPDFVLPNPAIYNSATTFPAQSVTLANDVTTFGYQIVTVNICPFEYIPSQRKLNFYNQINITINYTVGTIEYQERITERRHQITKEYVASSVQNPALITSIAKTANTIIDNAIDTNKLNIPWKPSAYGDMPDYIIITNETLKPHFQTLATYKTQRGMPTVLVTVEDIYQNYAGCDNAEKIRNYLKAAHQYWGAGLFVLLGGDTAVVPGRVGVQGTNNYTDLYYSDVYKPNTVNYNWDSNNNGLFGENFYNTTTGTYFNDGCELGSDNFIGRAPVDNIIEAQNFVNKINSYENLSGVTQTDFVNNMLFIGAYALYDKALKDNAVQNPNPPPYLSFNIPNGQAWHFKLANKPFLANPSLKKWQLYDDFQGTPFSNHPNNSNWYYQGNDSINRPKVLDLLKNGHPSIGKFHLVSHYDHGSPWGLSVSGKKNSNSIYREDMDVLTNGSYYQIMYSTSCESGEFQKDCFAEHYVNAPSGGGVAMIANTASVGTALNEQDNKLFNSIYGNLFPTSYYMGVAFANARDAYVGFNSKVLTLFGEPTMATWSATPQNITLAVPSSVTIDNTIANNLPVTINPLTNEATVTLYKYNTVTHSIEIFATQILQPGITTTNFVLHPDTQGELVVKVTAKNYLPATAPVNILLPQAHLYVTGFTITDTNGNGFVEQGETVNLTINLTNSGNTAISNINTLLSCNPAFATVLTNQASYTQLIPGQTVQLTGFTFVAQVANGSVVLPDFIEFFLNITADGNYTHLDNFYLDLKNPILNLGARLVTDSNNNPITNFTLNENANLSIKISNSGNFSTGALTATLTSSMVDSGIIELATPSSTYDSLESLTDKQNNTPFVFKFLQPHTGAKPFTLTLTNPFGKSWTFTFDLNEPLPPLITGFNFTSEKEEIRIKWNPISNIKGYNVYRSNEENGLYEKKNDFLILGSSVFNDTEVEVTSVYYYKISVVTLSGNELPLVQVVTNDNPPKQGYKAWTSLDNHGGFPIFANSQSFSPNCPPILYDVDNNNTKEIFVNYVNSGSETSGKIMGFYESGQELYNIDGNETTVSGFAETNIAMIPNAAVGDLDNDGHAEVLSIGRNNTTNEGKLYVYKTTDANADNKPDTFWNEEAIIFDHKIFRNPVLYDVDDNGYLDIIVVDEKQKVYVYDKNKNLLPGWPIQVGTTDYAEGQIAVADLDHDGKGEIAIGVKAISGTTGGIYIWNHDGTPFTTNPFKTFPNERADSGIVFADIDNDYNLDILTSTKQESIAKICAFNQSGFPVNSFYWDGQISLSVINTGGREHVMPHISVGDLNHDGNLEVVFGGTNKLYILDNAGNTFANFPKTINEMFDSAPILANIDNDTDTEIVINEDGKIFAYNYDGTSCIGFPLTTNNGMKFVGSPSVDDIDNDGKNEIVVASSGGGTYVFDTDGGANTVEWRSYRGNSQNTGTYKEVCNPALDLMIKDSSDDDGTEPNTITQYMWNSNNIWVRNSNDTSLDHENPEFSTTSPNYVKVRVINNSCVPSTGTEQIKLYWAKASTGLSWPNPWTGGVTYPPTNASMGNLIGTLNIPELQANEEVILTFPWLVPNPANYGTNGDQWHFCLLARIEATNDPMTVAETTNLNSNVRNNNNIAWKNVTVVDIIPNNVVDPGGVIAVENPFNETKAFYLEMEIAYFETGKPIYEEAEVGIKMDDVLYKAWERGGKESVRLDPTLKEKKKIVKGNNVILDNILFNPNEIGTLKLDFNFLTKELTNKENYVYHVIQKDATNGQTIGGETFVINKNPRNPFIADAGGDKIVDSNEPITISASDINEPAIYNWYDSDGNLIFQGKDLEIANAVTDKYKLEVISTVDGFKDYTEVEVTLKPNRFENIAPNPASSDLTINYKLNDASSAYIMIFSYYVTNGLSYNYIVDVNASQTTIDVSNYPTGLYTVALVANGAIVDAKILIKQ